MKHQPLHTPAPWEQLWEKNTEGEIIIQKTDGSLEPIAFINGMKKNA